MLLRREGLPEEGELLLCEVKKVHFHSVFVKILEYDMEGMIHISEIAPGRIRNIRDYVKEGKFIVCKALRVNKERRQVDLSLRRVNERERREKTTQITLEKRAEKIVEHVAKATGTDKESLYRQLTDQLFKDYEFLYDAFLDVSEGKLDLSKIKLPSKPAKELQESIKEKIKPPETVVKGHLHLTSFAPEGIEVIRRGVAELRKSIKDKFDISYQGGGVYSLSVRGPDYEHCEKVLKSILENLTDFFSKNQGEVSFQKI